MLKVKNNKVIRNLSSKHLKANNLRNVLAIVAIILTTVLFTSTYSTVGIMVKTIEQEVFRQVGTKYHAGFKNITKEQMDELITDKDIVSGGKRKILAIPSQKPFHKNHVELSYMDSNYAENSFVEMRKGHLPKKNSKEIACDTKFLELVGVEPKLGTEIKVSFRPGGDNEENPLITDTFTLCGWWEYDELSNCVNALVSQEYVEEQMKKSVNPAKYLGEWDYDFYLKNSKHIEKDVENILARHGYQCSEPTKENYIDIGVNWGYLNAQLSKRLDPESVVILIILTVLFILTGYFIIYNIFQISVVNDIRYYGLLKTLGTTKKQIRGMIHKQVNYLSLIGIPIGLAIGYGIGYIITPLFKGFISFKHIETRINPIIFIISAAFSYITVWISSRKPGLLAGKVSPIEAAKYTDITIKKKKKKSKKNTIVHMAVSNLNRNKKKTVMVVISLTLAILILQFTTTLSLGFDMDKFLSNMSVSDFLVGKSSYINVNRYLMDDLNAMDKDVQKEISKLEGIKDGGCIYGIDMDVQDVKTEEAIHKMYSVHNSNSIVNDIIDCLEKDESGNFYDSIKLYGMERYPLEKLKIIDGDISKINDPNQKAIIAIYKSDEYGNIEENTNWSKVGDKVKIRYIDEWEYYDVRSGKKIEEDKGIDDENVEMKVGKSHIEVYNVVATATINHSMSFRYYSSNEYVLNADVFKKDSGKDFIMSYLFDSTKESRSSINQYLSNFTQKKDTNYDFESKINLSKQLTNIKNIFLLIGGLLSFIVGLIGILNFLNAVITYIITRRHEFAMLRSIGMTTSQLKKLLVIEGVWYGVTAIIISLLLSLAAGPLLKLSLEKMLWFYSYRFTLIGILILAPIFLLIGILGPLMLFKMTSKKSIIEELRIDE